MAQVQWIKRIRHARLSHRHLRELSEAQVSRKVPDGSDARVYPYLAVIRIASGLKGGTHHRDSVQHPTDVRKSSIFGSHA